MPHPFKVETLLNDSQLATFRALVLTPGTTVDRAWGWMKSHGHKISRGAVYNYIASLGDGRAARLAGRSALRGLEPERALFRRGVLAELNTKIVAGKKLGFGTVRVINTFVAELEAMGIPGISVATIYNWEKEYQSGGLGGLIDRRAARKAAL